MSGTGFNYGRKRQTPSDHVTGPLPVESKPEPVPSNVLKRPVKLPPMRRIKK